MEVLYIIVGLAFMIFGIVIAKDPEKALTLKDRHKIKGKREYTDWAVLQMFGVGVLIVISGLILIVIQVVLLVR